MTPLGYPAEEPRAPERKGLGEIRRLVEDEPGDVFLGIRLGVCIIKTDHTLLRVSLIDGEYPDYRRVIPAEKGIGGSKSAAAFF